MPQALKARFKHVGIHVIDVDEMLAFYQRWFGLVKTDEGSGPAGKGVFLSSDPTEHHQIVFVAGREPGSQPVSLPLDLTQSDEAILAGVERAVRANPTFMMQDEGGSRPGN